MTLTKEQEETIKKLASIGQAADALLRAAELNNLPVDDENLLALIVATAKKKSL